MSNWPPDPKSLHRPAYRSLARALIAAIESGELPPGTRLPTQRELAGMLGLSVQTVGRAYDALTRADMISGRVGRGTFVTASPVEAGSIPYQRLERGEATIDCSMMTPAMDALHTEAFREAMQAVAGAPSADAQFSFRPRQALGIHRRATLDWLQRCGVRSHADQILITNGNTPAMTLALMTATKPGDLVACDEMSHHTLAPTARYLGLRLAPVAPDDTAMDPAALDALCARNEVSAIYVLPSGGHPEARVMDADRRAAICAIARRYGVRIIENDAWGPLEPGRPPPMVALAPDCVLYFTALTKCLMPGLRVGWLVVPEQAVSAATSRNLAMNWMATPLMMELASHWITEGAAERLLAWQRQAMARRNRMARRAFGDRLRGTPRGLHVWLPLDNGWTEDAFVIAARQSGVATASGRAFAMGSNHVDGVRISLGAPDESRLQTALSILSDLSARPAESSFLAI